MKTKELRVEWDCLLLVYTKLNWQGKSFARKRMNEIRNKLKLIEQKNNKK